MMINFNCPSCGKAYQLPQSVAGKTVPCNKCRTPMEIPSSTVVTPKTKLNQPRRSSGNVSLPAGNANVPATPIPANKKKYVIWTLLVLGGLMLLGIGFVGGRSTSVVVVDRSGADSSTDTEPSDSIGEDGPQETETEPDQEPAAEVEMPSEPDPAAQRAARIEQLLKEQKWEEVLTLDSNNADAKKMQIAALLKGGKWQEVLKLDSNNADAKQMQIAAEKAAKIADLLKDGKWQEVLKLDSNNADAKQMKTAQITNLLDKGDWKAVLALDSTNTKALQMKTDAETAATVILPNWQDEDVWEKLPSEIVARENSLGSLGGLFYIDFSVAKNKPPSPKIIPYQAGETRPAATKWLAGINLVIDKTFWKMTTDYDGRKYVVAYLRYIADPGILRFYRAPSGGFQGSDLGDKHIGGMKYKDLLAYSRLIQIHEGTYISAGISTAKLIGKLPGEQRANNARHTGIAAHKSDTPDSSFHRIPLTSLNACADEGFTAKPSLWNWRLVDICYRHAPRDKWQKFPVDLFEMVKTGKNSQSTIDSYGLKLKYGDLTYGVLMASALNANLRLETKPNSAANNAIETLKNKKLTLDRLHKERVGFEKGMVSSAAKLRVAQQDYARVIQLRGNNIQAEKVKEIAVKNASRLIAQNKSLIKSFENKIAGHVIKIDIAEKAIKSHLESYPELVAIKDDIKELNRYTQMPRLGNHELMISLEISHMRKLPDGRWINVPIWHASPVQPILDEMAEVSF